MRAFLKLKGKAAGDVKGSIKEKGKEGFIELVSVSHQLLSPRDAATGQAAGKRQHKPFVFTKEIDNTSPKLYEMMVKNDAVDEAVIRFYGPAITGSFGGAGVEKNIYTITLRGGNVIEVTLTMPNNREKPEPLPALYETVSIVYQSIEWLFHEGNVAAHDIFTASI